ncbi:TlpA family protein disulfide reductase [Myxococcota bacterium]|nr:TlpA family protein disulfide reductase [Myxococcota bacterium]
MSEGASAERSRGALFLLVAVFAAAALWFVIGSEESAAPVVRGARAPDFSLARWTPLSASEEPASEEPASEEPASEAPATGGPAAAAGSDGSSTPSGSLDLASLGGRVVLVNFWATWCEPCEREMPAMQRLYARLPRDRFELVAISIDEEPEKIGEFVERYALSFPIALDPGKRVATAYQTMGVPESLLVDAQGRIVERYVGPREWDAPEYVARIEALFSDAGSAGDGASPDPGGPSAPSGPPGRQASPPSGSP